MTPGQNSFAVGTGESYVYVYSIGRRSKRYARWRAEGVPTSISFMPSSDKIVLGSWQDSGVGMYQSNGQNDWVQSGDQDKLYFVQLDAAGDSVLSVAQPNRRVPLAILTLLDRTGAVLWEKEMRGEGIKALLSPTGRSVAVESLTRIEHRTKQVSEGHVALYDDAGNLVWDKGGMFFRPRLLAIPSQDAVVVYDDKFIYLLDRRGKVSAKEEVPGAIVKSWTDPGYTRFVVLCSNGKLYYYTLR